MLPPSILNSTLFAIPSIDVPFPIFFIVAVNVTFSPAEGKLGE